MERIERFNKKAASPKNKPDQILDALKIKPGDTILEIGVGGGYFANRFSEIIGKEGHYFGLDTNLEFIQNLKKLNKNTSNHNIKGIKVDPNEFPKIETKVDLIFTRNAYHHLEHRIEYFSFLTKLLSRKGRIAIIDYNETLSLMSLFKHFTKKTN